MAFTTLDKDQIRDQILRNITNLRPDIDVSADSETYVRADATASAVEGVYGQLAWAVRQILPDTEDLDWLIRFASRYAIYQKMATHAAGGTLAFTGQIGAPVAAGVVATTAGGESYISIEAGTIGGDGTLTLAGRAQSAGMAGNQDAAIGAALAAAPSGIDAAVTIAGMTGGTDVESQDALLARVLFRLRYPPSGGNKYDYRRWALEVDGVLDAYVYPLRRGVGTVDVAIVTAGGLASPDLVAAVQAHIDDMRAVKGECTVLAPTGVDADVTGTLALESGYLLADVLDSINAALDAYFATLAPGDTVYLQRINNIISNTAGVVDFILTAPTGNIATLVDATHVQLGVKGTVALTL